MCWITKTVTHRLQRADRIQSCDWNWFDLYSYPYGTWSNPNWRCQADLDLVFSKLHLSDFVAIALHLKQKWARERHWAIWYSRQGVVMTIHDPSMVFKSCKGMNETLMSNTEQVREAEWWLEVFRTGKTNAPGRADRERWVEKKQLDVSHSHIHVVHYSIYNRFTSWLLSHWEAFHILLYIPLYSILQHSVSPSSSVEGRKTTDFNSEWVSR